MSGKGGARSVSGPPPDPNALRRATDKRDWTHLSQSREGDAPSWPLTRASGRELRVWNEEWKRPQAVIWETNGQQREVALYVRALVTAEAPNARVQERTLVRQLMDDLGVSLVGMHRHRWIIDGQVEQEIVKPNDPARRSSKARLTSIEGGIAS